MATGSATVAETAGQARFTLPSSAGVGPHTARYTSRVPYDLTGDWFPVNIGTMVATGVAATAFFQHYLNGTNALQWVQLSGTIYARKIIAGVSTDLFSAAWSGTTYKYLAISEGGGTITWWSSTNGTSWTSRATLAAPFAVTDLYVDFGATCGNVASPGSFRVEDVNLILPALTTNWRWIQVREPLDERIITETTATGGANTIQGYLVTADGVDASNNPSGNVRYWAGPMNADHTLTEQLTQAAAQAMAVNFPLDGRLDLPEMIEGRCVRTYFRSITGSSVIWRELYPRRMVEADDIRAEIITALHIRAGSITADRLVAHTITANEISTIDLDATARITAGGQNVTLDDRGVSIVENASGAVTPNAVTWYEGIDPVAYVTTAKVSTVHTLHVVGGDASTGRTGRANILALGKTGFTDAARDAQLDLIGSSAVGVVSSATLSAHIISLTGADSVSINKLNLGTATGAGAGQLATSGVAAINGQAISGNVGLNVKGAGTTNATAAIQGFNSTGLLNFRANDDGTIRTRGGVDWDLRGGITGTGAATKRLQVAVNGVLYNLLAN